MLDAYLPSMPLDDTNESTRHGHRGSKSSRRTLLSGAFMVALALVSAGFGLMAWHDPVGGISYRAWAGPQAGAVLSDTQVANTSTEWRTLWSSLRHDPPPAFDPARQTGVAIMLGQRPTPGYEVAVVGTEQRGERLVVVVEETRPPTSRTQPQTATSPFTIMLIDRSAATVSVEKRVRD